MKFKVKIFKWAQEKFQTMRRSKNQKLNFIIISLNCLKQEALTKIFLKSQVNMINKFLR